MLEEIRFDDKPIIEIPVHIPNDPTLYILREADEEAAIKYKAASLGPVEMTFDDENDTRTVKNIGNLASAECLLVQLCMFEKLKNDKGEIVGERNAPPVTVRKWGHKVIKCLYEKAKEISKLGEDEATVEELEKQKAKLQKRIDKIKRNDPKNEQKSTETITT